MQRKLYKAAVYVETPSGDWTVSMLLGTRSTLDKAKQLFGAEVLFGAEPLEWKVTQTPAGNVTAYHADTKGERYNIAVLRY